MKTRRAILLSALALFALLAAASALAQSEDWQTKPYQQWTMKDVQKVLSDSPWAKTIARTGPQFNGENMPDKIYTLRLRSALPIRQGLLRLRQLKEEYDKMSDKKKAEFDEKNKALIDCPPCDDNYVIALVPPSGADARMTLPTSMKSASLETMKLYVQLSDDRGQRRELVHFVPPKSPGQEVVFFFPKFNEKGEPLITPSSKRVVFNIDPAVLGGDSTITHFDLDVSKMIVNGKVVF
ncbi:MAG: hypothetical protein QOC99_2055 [Acidobacteriota bacterium]|jgi:hypothetical protein|nr:hypothetical protein [Acidobacteriota bacterium]MDT7779543.1 hypothetical protein [Acidobacteriota bacterium]